MRNFSKKSILALLIAGGVIALSSYQVLTLNPSLVEVASKIKLPAGFRAEIVAENLGNLRHIAVNKNGDIYAKLSKLKEGHGMYFLQDRDKDGQFKKQQLLTDYPGTGVAIHDGYLYSSSNTEVLRYKLNKQEEIIDINLPEKLVTGLVDKGRDSAKPFTLDGKGNIYVTVGSYNDNCREAGSSKGMSPCTVLDSAGGIWKFSINKRNQKYADGERYVTGIKNAVGIGWNFKTNSLFATNHGRGKFDDMYPQYYTPKQSAELPAETFYQLKKGDDVGWPSTYYDHLQNKTMLAPEYGGDGVKTGTGSIVEPIAAFPAHLAPNDLLFYTGKMFPTKYKNGAFIAFHSQSPELKKGYFIAFVPFENGKAGKWEIFADNFAGVDLANPDGPIQHRPCGVAQGPDGALYVTDDLNGTIFKISY